MTFEKNLGLGSMPGKKSRFRFDEFVKSQIYQVLAVKIPILTWDKQGIKKATVIKILLIPLTQSNHNYIPA